MANGSGKAERSTLHGMNNDEHDKIVSRTRGVSMEIAVGTHGRAKNSYGGLVPSNPFASLAQEGWAHANPKKFGEANLAEWDKASKGRKIPEHVK